MPFTGKVGDTLYMRDDSETSHPYVILTNKNKEGKVVIVNFTHAAYWKECVVIFKPKHDKRLFKKDSTVSYKDARMVDHQKLLALISKKPKRQAAYCQPNILAEVVKGAFISDETPQEIKEELRANYPNIYDKCKK